MTNSNFPVYFEWIDYLTNHIDKLSFTDKIELMKIIQVEQPEMNLQKNPFVFKKSGTEIKLNRVTLYTLNKMYQFMLERINHNKNLLNDI